MYWLGAWQTPYQLEQPPAAVSAPPCSADSVFQCLPDWQSLQAGQQPGAAAWSPPVPVLHSAPADYELQPADPAQPTLKVNVWSCTELRESLTTSAPDRPDFDHLTMTDGILKYRLHSPAGAECMRP